MTIGTTYWLMNVNRVIDLKVKAKRNVVVIVLVSYIEKRKFFRLKSSFYSRPTFAKTGKRLNPKF